MFNTRRYLRRRTWWAWLLLLAFLPQWMMKSLHHHEDCVHEYCTAVHTFEPANETQIAKSTQQAQPKLVRTADKVQQQSPACEKHKRSQKQGGAAKQSTASDDEDEDHAGQHLVWTKKVLQENCPLCDFTFFHSTPAVDFYFDFSQYYNDAIAIAPSSVYVSAQEKVFYLRGPPAIF